MAGIHISKLTQELYAGHRLTVTTAQMMAVAGAVLLRGAAAVVGLPARAGADGCAGVTQLPAGRTLSDGGILTGQPLGRSGTERWFGFGLHQDEPRLDALLRGRDRAVPVELFGVMVPELDQAEGNAPGTKARAALDGMSAAGRHPSGHRPRPPAS
ncbi:hypothetical protein [Tistlia consotensis]|uniref:hypothetical protein n=1 Tax=Tistlia consotensis TaxID=1321365 RepID=UPI000A1663E7|nr:hypothetical protein [Tistlia consotensis]